jgi:tetratricopeptide (TPR) repeat protein
MSAKPQITPPSSATAEAFLVEAMKVALAEGSEIPAMPFLQKALAIGLAPKDEVEARLSLGGGYREIFGNSGLSWQKMVEANEFRQCLVEIEKAFELDRKGSLGFFSQPLSIGRLQHLDLMYTLAAQAKQEQEGTDAAIAYLAAKLAAVDYLKRPPLLASLLRLADLYRGRGAFEDAARCLRKVLGTEPLYPADQERNEEFRETARQMISEIEGQESSGAPVPVPSGYCAQCRKPISSGARFCNSCGANVSSLKTQTGPSSGSPSSFTGASDIASLQRLAQEHPNDESYQKLLAVALHDDSLASCERDPQDGSLLFTSIQQICHAREQLTRALSLRFNDTQLRSDLEAALRDVNKMEKRKFVGSWFLVVIWGLFYIVPGVVFWAGFRRPRYLMNRDYVAHMRTGKHIGAGARIGGAMGKVYDFCDKISPDWGWIIGLAIFVILSPMFVVLAYKENYLDVKKELTPATSAIQ